METKVAIPTDDGNTISRHFGQAKFFKVITLLNNEVSSAEMREKASHQHGAHSIEQGIHPGQLMVDAISDCQVLISGGMGTPAYARATQAGLIVILTRLSSISDSLDGFIAGTLKNDPGLVHPH